MKAKQIIDNLFIDHKTEKIKPFMIFATNHALGNQ